MDLLDLSILALRLALAALLYLFLFVVVRTAWRALRTSPDEVLPQPPSADGARQTVQRTRSSLALRLLVLEPGGSDLPPGQVIELGHGATFGRAERASVLLADPAVSAEHARIVRLEDAWLIADLGSTNGTLVNQALVQGETTLEPGDIVALGNVRLKVVGR